MASRILALFIWAAVAASIAFWGLRWLASPLAVPPNASAVSLDNAGKGDPHRLLAGPAKASGPAAPDNGQNAMLAGRIKLIGVVAPKNPEDHDGVALVSVDGKPPRAVHIGDVVDGSNVVKRLTQRSAEIGPVDGPTAVTLDLPALPAPATGVITPAVGLTTNVAQNNPGAQPTGAAQGMPAPNFGADNGVPPPPDAARHGGMRRGPISP